MYKFCVCGHFAFGKNLLNGQTVKTKIIADELDAQLGETAVKKIDTHGGKLQVIWSVLSAVGAMFICRNLVILPAHNGVRVFGPVLAFFRKWSHCKLHYSVIGGWLPKLLEGSPSLAKALKKFDHIYVETTTMRNALEAQGFDNIVVMPNCKKLTVLTEDELVYHKSTPYPLCTFSRVMQEKGIEDAVYAVKTINEQNGETLFTLDIYGPVDAGYQERFSDMQKEWPNYIRYRGSVPFDESVETLKSYFALLFPTRFYTEGIPGTIIDAYAAGVPVISSRWESFSDVIDENQTGYGYEFENAEQLISLLLKIAKEPEMATTLKLGCCKKAHQYLAYDVVKRFFSDRVNEIEEK